MHQTIQTVSKCQANQQCQMDATKHMHPNQVTIIPCDRLCDCHKIIANPSWIVVNDDGNFICLFLFFFFSFWFFFLVLVLFSNWPCPSLSWLHYCYYHCCLQLGIFSHHDAWMVSVAFFSWLQWICMFSFDLIDDDYRDIWIVRWMVFFAIQTECCCCCCCSGNQLIYRIAYLKP